MLFAVINQEMRKPHTLWSTEPERRIELNDHEPKPQQYYAGCRPDTKFLRGEEEPLGEVAQEFVRSSPRVLVQPIML